MGRLHDRAGRGPCRDHNHAVAPVASFTPVAALVAATAFNILITTPLPLMCGRDWLHRLHRWGHGGRCGGQLLPVTAQIDHGALPRRRRRWGRVGAALRPGCAVTVRRGHGCGHGHKRRLGTPRHGHQAGAATVVAPILFRRRHGQQSLPMAALLTTTHFQH